MASFKIKSGSLFQGTKSRIDLLDKRGVRIMALGFFIALLAWYLTKANWLLEGFLWSPMPESEKLGGSRAPNVIVPYLISKAAFVSGYSAGAETNRGPDGWELAVRSLSYLVHCAIAVIICWFVYCGRLEGKIQIGGAAIIGMILMQLAPLSYRSSKPSTEGTDHYYVAAHNSHLANETKEVLIEAPDEFIGPAAFILAQYAYHNKKPDKLPLLLDRIKEPWPGINEEEKRRLAKIISFAEAKSKQSETGPHTLPPGFASLRNPHDDVEQEKSEVVSSENKTYSMEAARKVSGSTKPIVDKPRLADQIKSQVNTVATWMFVLAIVMVFMARGVRKKATAFSERFNKIGLVQKAAGKSNL